VETNAKRVIKRYSNRKLYDTKGSRYVTLLQIAEIVRGGEEVQIIDNNSKDDLTEVTLAQIIFEEQKANQKTLPLQTLRELIHTRTEGVLSQLREGPIGRLIPGVPSKDGAAGGSGVATGPVPTSKESSSPPDADKGDKSDKTEKSESTAPGAVKAAPGKSLVDQAKGTIEGSLDAGRSWASDFQHRIDERVKALMPTAPWVQVQQEVKKLQGQVDALEAELRELKASASAAASANKP